MSIDLPGFTPPTVGRIVHFYDSRLNLNGQGAGPYPAIILQTWPGQPYVNLKVLGWGEDAWDEGSVYEQSETNTQPRHWCWPPRG